MAYLKVEHVNGDVVYINLKKVIGYRVETNPHRISVDMDDGNTYYIHGDFKSAEDIDVVIQFIIEQSHQSSSYVIKVPSMEEANIWYETTYRYRR